MTSPVRTTAAIAALFGVLGIVGPTLSVPSLHAQQTRAGREGCDLVRSQRLNSILTQGGERITYISGPLVFQCEDGTRIQADSVVDFQATRFRRLLGGVEIDGPEIRLQAQRVHQSDDAGRLEAWGSVEVEQKGTETRMVGDSLVFLESGPARERSELTVMGERPYAVLRLGEDEGQGAAGGRPGADPGDRAVDGPPPDVGAGAPPPPDTVYADRLHMAGEDRFVATGAVRVQRPDLEATADSLDFDRDENVAHLFGTPEERARIDGEEFDLVARRVELFLEGGALREILAVDRARLTGEDVEMDAPRIRIFMTDDQMDRLVAVEEARGSSPTDTAGAGPPSPGAGGGTGRATTGVDSTTMRPRATAEDFVLWADSIEVSAPGQRLDQVFAVGGARGESLGRDSLNTPDMPDLIRRDWIEGDTIVAHFLPADSFPMAPDTADPDTPIATDDPPQGGPPPPVQANPADPGEERPEYRLDRLVATGSARSLYRLAPQDTVSVVTVDEEGVEEEAEVTGGAPGNPVNPGDTAVATRPDSVGGAGRASPRRRPAVHYVIGDRITIVLSRGDVERMEVEGQTRGIYLEPVVRRSGAPGAGPIDGAAPDGARPAEPDDGTDGDAADGTDDGAGSPGGVP
ncbi:MAG: hypothetical protein R3223_02875 [Longimicrobiales bacterium]|nr:hypothetical protein [Longimicrobiales bacterium]